MKASIHTTELKLLEKHGLIAGVDEAGRGPLAGPVVSAAVVLDEAFHTEKQWLEIRESKNLSDKQRREWVVFIHQNARSVGVGTASVEEIDELNILRAALLSMKRAVQKLTDQPGYLLIDGRYPVPGLEIDQLAEARADSQFISVAAASIVAKVVRDDLMIALDETYPEFRFGQHKGYPTDFHRKALYEQGPTPIHRKTFSTVREAMSESFQN